MNGDGLPMEFDGAIFTPTQGHIRSFLEIPDIITLDVPPADYIVPALGIARNTITLWTGADGDGKTYLVQALAVAVARGGEFLGMLCQKSPVLYVDLENAAYTVQDRLRPMTGEQSVPELRVWGMWNQQQPPAAGSELLLTIAKETKPVIIVDPFRYFHTAEENDSTAMAGVMQYLRACAAYGCAVIILHHPAKAEGSTGRGSSAIRGACDLAFLHSLDKESQLITLKVDKNRNGESRTITIRADFEQGTFSVTDAPYITRRNEEMGRLGEIIRASPGSTQNAICKLSGMMKARVGHLLKEGTGTLWLTRSGPNRSKIYYPFGWFSDTPELPRTTEPQEGTGVGGSGGSPLKGREPPNHRTPTPSSGGSSHSAAPPTERLCAKHGFHSDWRLSGDVQLCRKCHCVDSVDGMDVDRSLLQN